MIKPVVPPTATVARPEEWITARKEASVWINNAYKIVNGAFPSIDWTFNSPEIDKAQAHFEWYVWAFFYSKTATISDVQEAWKAFYKLHIPGQQQLIEASPTGDT